MKHNEASTEFAVGDTVKIVSPKVGIDTQGYTHHIGSTCRVVKVRRSTSRPGWDYYKLAGIDEQVWYADELELVEADTAAGPHKIAGQS